MAVGCFHTWEDQRIQTEHSKAHVFANFSTSGKELVKIKEEKLLTKIKFRKKIPVDFAYIRTSPSLLDFN